jgi:hypothetical protein
MKWEYAFVVVEGGDLQQLNKGGAAGWEAVGIVGLMHYGPGPVPRNPWFQVLLKRPVR